MRLTLLIIMCLCATPVYAQCVAEVKDVLIDEVRGSIIVETEYTLNGVVVQEKGRNRFLNTSGDNASIIEQAMEGIKWHCNTLLKRIEVNRVFIDTEIQKRLDELKVGRTSELIIENIKDDLIGEKETKTEAITEFKGKDIKVTYDSKNTVSDTAITP